MENTRLGGGKMKRKIWVISLTGVFLAVLLSVPADKTVWAAAKVYNWKMQVNITPSVAYDALQRDFCDSVEKMSGGRMKIKLHPIDAIFPIKEGLEAIGGGVVEVCTLSGGYFIGKIGPFATFESGVPGAERNAIERYNFFWERGFINLCREVFSKHNIYYLGPHLSASWDIISKVPLRTMEDFKGKKIRGFGIEAEWFKAMGAAPVFIPGSELYTGLATGLIDAVRWGSPDGNRRVGLHEVAKYYLNNPILPAPNNFFAVNMKAWNSLPEDLKAILEVAAKQAGWGYVTGTAYLDMEAVEKMKKKGVEFITIPPDEWAKMEKLARDIWNKYGEKDPTAAKAVKMLNDYLTFLGR
jgi:TRAP-type mannitol/chloroaromatic compound transport system substrate-binding protein